MDEENTHLAGLSESEKTWIIGIPLLVSRVDLGMIVTPFLTIKSKADHSS